MDISKKKTDMLSTGITNILISKFNNWGTFRKESAPTRTLLLLFTNTWPIEKHKFLFVDRILARDSAVYGIGEYSNQTEI